MEFSENLEKAAALKRRLDKLQVEYDACMEPVKEYCVNHPGERVSGFGFKVSAMKASESVTVDLKALEEAEPELFGELLEDYPKKTVRKPYARVSFDGR